MENEFYKQAVEELLLNIRPLNFDITILKPYSREAICPLTSCVYNIEPIVDFNNEIHEVVRYSIPRKLGDALYFERHIIEPSKNDNLSLYVIANEHRMHFIADKLIYMDDRCLPFPDYQFDEFFKTYKEKYKL